MELATDHEFSLDDWKQLPDMQRGFHITAPFHRCKSRSQERATNHNAARNKTAVYPLCLSGEVAIGGFRISWGPASSSEAERTQSEFERGYRYRTTFPRPTPRDALTDSGVLPCLRRYIPRPCTPLMSFCVCP